MDNIGVTIDFSNILCKIEFKLINCKYKYPDIVLLSHKVIILTGNYIHIFC